MKSESKTMTNSSESEMKVKPIFEREYDLLEKKLINKVALITGGDSGIGRAISVAFARHGANVAITYRQNSQDAKETKRLVMEKGAKAIIIQADISLEKNCVKVVQKIVAQWGKIDILINNAAVQFPQENITKLDEKQILQTFRTNLFSQFFLIQAALPYMKKGASVINTASLTAYAGNPVLLDYSASKGAIVSFTRSLSEMLIKKGIRVNAVSPGPVWTPLIVSSFPEESLKTFGKDVAMGRAGQPAEIAPAYVFLASEDASYISGQVIHVNGGQIVNG